MEQLITAYTDTKFGDYPAFINVYEAMHDGVVINIRNARKSDGTQGDCASIELQSSTLRELVTAIMQHPKFDWLPSWVAEYNAATKREKEIEVLKEKILNAQSQLAIAECKNDRIKRKLESWYQP